MHSNNFQAAVNYFVKYVLQILVQCVILSTICTKIILANYFVIKLLDIIILL